TSSSCQRSWTTHDHRARTEGTTPRDHQSRGERTHRKDTAMKANTNPDLPPMIVVGDMQVYVTDDDITDLIGGAVTITPHDLEDVPSRPVIHVKAEDDVGCFVVVSRPSALYTSILD